MIHVIFDTQDACEAIESLESYKIDAMEIDSFDVPRVMATVKTIPAFKKWMFGNDNANVRHIGLVVDITCDNESFDYLLYIDELNSELLKVSEEILRY